VPSDFRAVARLATRAAQWAQGPRSRPKQRRACRPRAVCLIPRAVASVVRACGHIPTAALESEHSAQLVSSAKSANFDETRQFEALQRFWRRQVRKLSGDDCQLSVKNCLESSRFRVDDCWKL